tara:strand:+ start:2963 stop:4171 length:1209 start_codon:yes stop_codon:yes gene_type:complete
MGFFSKLWRGVKKTFKKIGKGIKKVFKKVGKWAGKLGVVGQIALSFIPFGQIFAPMLSGLSSSFLGVLGKGLAAANPIVKGASWMVNAAYKTGSAIYKGYKTVTGAVSKFIGETVGFIGSKIPGVNKVIGKDAAGSFFGTGSDSVLGRVGEQVSADWGGFKKAVGGIIELNPTAKGVEYMKDANILKGEYRYDSPDINPKTGELFDRTKDGDIIPGTSISVQDQIQRSGGQLPEYLKDKPMYGSSIYTGKLDAVTEKSFKLTASPNGLDAIGTAENLNVKPVEPPVDDKSLLGRVGDSMVDSAVNLPANLATSLATGAVQQEVMGDTMPEPKPRNALDLNYGSRSYDVGQVISSMAPLITTPTNFYQNSEYNLLMANLMNTFGVSGGAFGNWNTNLSQQQAA